MSHKAYVFDIDDNLLHTNCIVFLEREVESKKERIEIPERELKTKLQEGRSFPDNDPEECFRNMRLGNGKLTQDLLEALEKKAYGPAWERFKLANLQASPIGIITARGHPIEELKKAHNALLHEVLAEDEKEMLLDHIKIRFRTKEKNEDILLERYFDHNYYASCSNREYSASLGILFETPVPQKKVLAFEKFIEHIVQLNQEKLMNPDGKVLKIWFSDDSLDNIEAIQEAIETRFIQSYPQITFATYNTNIPHAVKKILTSGNAFTDPNF